MQSMILSPLKRWHWCQMILRELFRLFKIHPVTECQPNLQDIVNLQCSQEVHLQCTGNWHESTLTTKNDLKTTTMTMTNAMAMAMTMQKWQWDNKISQEHIWCTNGSERIIWCGSQKQIGCNCYHSQSLNRICAVSGFWVPHIDLESPSPSSKKTTKNKLENIFNSLSPCLATWTHSEQNESMIMEACHDHNCQCPSKLEKWI